MSDSVRPHRRQPTRLPRPWDSPGKNTREGCHFLLQRMKVKSESEVPQSCPTLSDPMDCSLPGSSVLCLLSPFMLLFSLSLSLFFCPFLSLVSQSCPTLCNPMDCSMPVHHQLPEFIQTHVHRVGDTIQPSHPLSSPSPPALNLSQHQGLFQ